MFQRILVANRGEIALRVIRACKELDIEVVAVYSQADKDAPYLALANRAICIGKAASSDSYLNRSRIIAAAEVADAQAIHPGYGFLSENPDFAEVCRSSGFEFIGPPHEAIRKMGLKTEAKLVAAKAQVACVPGSDGVVAIRRRGDAARTRHRLPGLDQGRRRRWRQGHARLPRRGQPRCLSADRRAMKPRPPSRTPASTLKNSSIDPGMSKSRSSPIHTATSCTAGTAIAASSAAIKSSSKSPLLRPCPWKSRTKLGEAAVRLARAAGYVNAGTCEFLVDADHNFYFIEVNARIQVEHPVTEMVTGIDLVKQQIKIAAGLPLPFGQKDIATRGHSIECRINSEDPDHDFRPSPGRITAFRIPGGPGVRWDSHIQLGYSVPPHYDSLLGKLIVHAPTPRRSPCHNEAGTRRAGDRGRRDDHSLAPSHISQPGLHLRAGRYHLGRTSPASLEIESSPRVSNLAWQRAVSFQRLLARMPSPW